VASYGGGGGGHDLVAAGAVHSSTLRPGQARILLAALLASKSPAETIVSAFGDSPLF
jgi:L-asparaginase